jgi:hypothetical protein
MEHPKAGRLKDLAEAESTIAGGTDVGIFDMRFNFVWEYLQCVDEEFHRKYEEYLKRQIDNAQSTLDSLVYK